MKNCFIISRYSEDISWLDKLKEHKIIIYNKGQKIEQKPFYKILNVENVGRESHTWLLHIVENYYRLDDVNIFLQGRIDDLGCMTFKDPLDYCRKIDKYGFSVSRYGLLGPFHWSNNVGIEKDPRYKDKWEKNLISKSELGFRKFSQKIFPKIPLFVATSYGGCFGVKKELIMQHDIDFYKYLLKILASHKDPIEGHYMERLWCYMFTNNKPIKNSIIDVITTKFENLFRK